VSLFDTTSCEGHTLILVGSDSEDSDYQTPQDPRIADIDLDYYDFPSTCPDCGAENVYPMGATDCNTGNIRECFNCDERWVEG
jgi:hypothetical protein